MQIIGAGGKNRGAGRFIRFLARRGGRTGRMATRVDNWRTHRQMRKRGWL